MPLPEVVAVAREAPATDAIEASDASRSQPGLLAQVEELERARDALTLASTG